jgi:Glucodextranase, domain B
MLSVDSPANLLSVGSAYVQVYGAFTGPTNTGITVNGMAVATTATRFASSVIPLQPGSNTLTITTMTMDGAVQTVTRTVIFDANQSPDVEFVARAASGFAPTRIEFGLSFRLPPAQTALSRVEIDYDGNGVFEYDAATVPTNLAFNYNDGGDYAPLARLSFDDGMAVTPLVVRESSPRVLLETLARSRQTLCFVYYELKHRLQTGASGLPSALLTMTPELRAEYQPLFISLGANLASAGNPMGEIVDGQIADVTAEFMVAVPDPAIPGEFFGFPVHFRRSSDGVWRIAEL